MKGDTFVKCVLGLSIPIAIGYYSLQATNSYRYNYAEEYKKRHPDDIIFSKEAQEQGKIPKN